MFKMKSSIVTILMLAGLLLACSCADSDLQDRFPDYYGLETFKGLEVYIWQTGENGGSDYRCGLLPGTNRNKSPEELADLTENGATFAEMREILSSYDIEKGDIFITPISDNGIGGWYIDSAQALDFDALFWAGCD